MSSVTKVRTPLQDGEVKTKQLEGSGHDVEEEILTWLHELTKQEVLTSNDALH